MLVVGIRPGECHGGASHMDLPPGVTAALAPRARQGPRPAACHSHVGLGYLQDQPSQQAAGLFVLTLRSGGVWAVSLSWRTAWRQEAGLELLRGWEGSCSWVRTCGLPALRARAQCSGSCRYFKIDSN